MSRSEGRNGETRLVRDLLEAGAWNANKLKQLFTTWEVEAITSIPIPRIRYLDSWAWHHSKCGDFLVRSAYYIAIEEKKRKRASSSGNDYQLVWKNLWEAQVPTKMKLFGWRALQEGIATSDNLAKRGIEGDRQCPMCGEVAESTMHMLLECGGS